MRAYVCVFVYIFVYIKIVHVCVCVCSSTILTFPVSAAPMLTIFMRMLFRSPSIVNLSESPHQDPVSSASEAIAVVLGDLKVCTATFFVY